MRVCEAEFSWQEIMAHAPEFVRKRLMKVVCAGRAAIRVGTMPRGPSEISRRGGPKEYRHRLYLAPDIPLAMPI